MGILDEVAGNPLGLIPRSLSHIFGAVAAAPDRKWRISLSFMQIYLESVQDLFAQPHAVEYTADGYAEAQSSNMPSWESSTRVGDPSFDSDAALSSGRHKGGTAGRHARARERVVASALAEGLPVREAPGKGFYVEGLQEYDVSSFPEAVEILNWGLDNRAMGPTAMNATSSRAHTILTVRVQHSGSTLIDGRETQQTLSGRLLLVDLAGSERVRRTTSKGTRLVEAKSINQSLSALGNVIVALSDNHAPHVPYRDSKLTRLLQGCIGGGAATYLVATVAPEDASAAETLSTMQFASRCMRVASRLVRNEEVDYAVLCARLQSQLASLEERHMQQARESAAKYETHIQQLQGALEHAASGRLGSDEVRTLLAGGGGLEHLPDDASSVTSAGGHSRSLQRLYSIVCAMFDGMLHMLRLALKQDAALSKQWHSTVASQQALDEGRAAAEASMAAADPMGGAEAARFGPHLDKPSPAAAMRSAHASHSSPLQLADGASHAPQVLQWLQELSVEHPKVETSTARELSSHCHGLLKRTQVLLDAVKQTLSAGSVAWQRCKRDLAAAQAHTQQREEELTNQSYVLKYLVDANAVLRSENSTLQAAAELERSTADAEALGPGELNNHSAYNGHTAAGPSQHALPSAGQWPTAVTPRPAAYASKSRRAVTSVQSAKSPASTGHRHITSAPHPIRAAQAAPYSAAGSAHSSMPASPLASSASAAGGGGGAGGDEVESIVGRRSHKGQLYYKVHWRGTSAAEDEWFERGALMDDFPTAVKRYEVGYGRRR